MKTEIKNKKVISHLEPILSRTALIANPTRLDIPELGEVTATSMVNYHVFDGKLIPYFTFVTGKKELGEFFRKDNKYYVSFNAGRKVA
jgi:hypothetical protein